MVVSSVFSKITADKPGAVVCIAVKRAAVIFGIIGIKAYVFHIDLAFVLIESAAVILFGTAGLNASADPVRFAKVLINACAEIFICFAGNDIHVFTVKGVAAVFHIDTAAVVKRTAISDSTVFKVSCRAAAHIDGAALVLSEPRFIRPTIGNQRPVKVGNTVSCQFNGAALIGGAAVIERATRHIQRTLTLN